MSTNLEHSCRLPEAREWEKLLARHTAWREKSEDARFQKQLVAEDLDLRDADFGEEPLELAHFHRCRFEGRSSWPTSLKGCQFHGCDLSDVTFDGVDLSETRFEASGNPKFVMTDLTRAVFRRARLQTATFESVSLSETKFEGCTFFTPDENKRSVSFGACTGSKTQFRDSDLRRSQFSRTELSCAQFEGANLSDSVIGQSTFKACDFRGASLGGPNMFIEETRFVGGCAFRGATFSGAIFRKVDLQECDFRRASFDRTSFEKGVEVDYAVFSGARGMHGRYGPRLEDIRGAERARYSFKGDICSWSRVRTVGTIRLFSVSYLAIILIWLYVRAVEWFNAQLVAFQAEHELAAQFPILSQLKPLPIPSDLVYLLSAIILLAVGATTYTFWCPSIITENTETRWKNELNREVFEYRIHAWRFPLVRWISGLCYIVGGSWVVLQLSVKVWHVLKFLFGEGGVPIAEP